MPAPAPDLVARFRRDLDALIDPATSTRIGIAVSGGPDSLALLLLAHAAYAGQVHAATVDHRVRPANAAEAAAVATLCASLGIEHATLAADAPLPANPNQDWARSLRYGLLQGWMKERRLDVLATAHHADDQAETLLMRANRGSGIGGLAGIRAHTSLGGGGLANTQLVRPLLGWRRTELRAIVDAAELHPIDDPSNRNPAFDRTHARDLLAANSWLDPVRLAATSAHAADAQAALDWSVDRLWNERSQDPVAHGTACLDLAGLPPEYARRLVVRAMAHVRGVTSDATPPRGAAIDRLLQAASGTSSTLAGVRIDVTNDIWRFTPAPPRRPCARTDA